MTDHAREAATKIYKSACDFQLDRFDDEDATEIIQSAIDASTAELRADRLLLAKLAADEPQFYNPMEAMAAKALRDRVLQEAAEQIKQRGGK